MLELNAEQLRTILLAVDVLRVQGVSDWKESGIINTYNAREVWDLKEVLINALARVQMQSSSEK